MCDTTDELGRTVADEGAADPATAAVAFVCDVEGVDVEREALHVARRRAALGQDLLADY